MLVMFMDKVKINAIIKTEEEKIKEKTTGSIISGVISYKENSNTYVYLDLNKDELIRENEQMLMKYSFDKNRRTKGFVTIKDMNKNLELDIQTMKLEKKEHQYYVEYKIEENKFIYEIEYMEE